MLLAVARRGRRRRRGATTGRVRAGGAGGGWEVRARADGFPGLGGGGGEACLEIHGIDYLRNAVVPPDLVPLLRCPCRPTMKLNRQLIDRLNCLSSIISMERIYLFVLNAISQIYCRCFF